MRSLTRLSQSITRPEASSLRMSGASASAGSWSITPPMRSRTSFAASSMSRSSVNSSWIIDTPSSLLELMASSPAMPAMRSSIGCVMRVSTTAAEAPR